MTQSSISTARRLQYAAGYLALGLVADAEAELDAIEGEDRKSDEVLELTIDLHSARQNWDLAVTAAQEYVHRQPDDPKGWISWAFALRRLKSIADAEQILLLAEKRIGSTCALVHYNLACYRCLAGDTAGALEALSLAVQLDPANAKSAVEDADFASIRSDERFTAIVA